MSALYTALQKAHAKLLLAPMDSVNPAFKSKYASLESILKTLKPVLAECGLFVSQFPIGQNTLRTVVGHVSGEKIVSSFSMTPQTDKPHAIGSNISYMRRYALISIFAMVGDPDDDGNEASKPAPKTAAKEAPKVDPWETILATGQKNGWDALSLTEYINDIFGKVAFSELTREEQIQLYKTVSAYGPTHL
ncbi:MAG: hypothetical protein E6R04_08770 [Spirochaetes bacterium]|nr:MAG: hypothetical protein E6R04_08770 [Spirochaetota bacterium]